MPDMPPLGGWLQPKPILSVRSFFSLIEIFIRLGFFSQGHWNSENLSQCPPLGPESVALGQSCCGAWVLLPGAQLVPRPVGGLEVTALRKQRGFTVKAQCHASGQLRGWGSQCQGPRADEDKLMRWALTGWGCDAHGSPMEQDHPSFCFRSPLCTHPLPINDTNMPPHHHNPLEGVRKSAGYSE